MNENDSPHIDSEYIDSTDTVAQIITPPFEETAKFIGFVDPSQPIGVFDPADHSPLADPCVIEQYGLLRDIGILGYIESLTREIQGYKRLFSGVMDIFNHTSIEDIMDAAVFQISQSIFSSCIVFLWQPFQNREEIIVKGYENYRPIDLGLCIESLVPFEDFFHRFKASSAPVSYEVLLRDMQDKSAVKALEPVNPDLIVPIMGPSQLYGLILVGGKILGGHFTTDEVEFLQNLMNFVSLAIQNKIHYDHSLRDIKTGLYNYGFFITRLDEELFRMRRNRYPSSVVVIDVDHFKSFNDTFGHIAGDRVLEHIASQIKQRVRSDDIPSRFGGEEFTLLLPNAASDVAWGVAERLRCSIAGLRVPWDVPLPQVTISLGIYTFTCEDIKASELCALEVIDRADKALYDAKSRGRNQTVIYIPREHH